MRVLLLVPVLAVALSACAGVPLPDRKSVV